MSYQDTIETPMKKRPIRSHSDFVFGRIGFLAILFVLYTIFILYTPEMIDFAYNTVWVLSVGLAAASVVLFLLSHRAKKVEGRVFTCGFLARTALSCAALLAVTFFFRDASTLIILAFVAVCLALIRNLFSHDFFWISAALAAGLLFAVLPRVFVVFGGELNNVVAVASAVCAVSVALALAVVALIAGRGGRFGRRFFNAGCVRRYPLFVVPTCIVTVTLLRFFLPFALSYAMTATVVLYFIFLIAYAFDGAK